VVGGRRKGTALLPLPSVDGWCMEVSIFNKFTNGIILNSSDERMEGAKNGKYEADERGKNVKII
jgi:hypothetical protein